MSLRDYGWSAFFRRSFESLEDPRGLDLRPGRILTAAGSRFRMATEHGETAAVLAGRIAHRALSPAGLPAVGDWVAFEAGGAGTARIVHLLPRRTRLSRKSAGRRTDEQVVAANVDRVILVMGLDGDFNIRRAERFLATIAASGAEPSIVLNKIDLCEGTAAKLGEVRSIAPGVPILPTNCLEGEGVAAVEALIPPAETAVLVGSSGAGKSTLINRLLSGEVQKISEVRRSDSRGRHTTTHREMFRLPSGGLLIDNPGIRELQLWAGEESLGAAFGEIAGLAGSCRFRNCTHQQEPGCAVLEAVDSGDLAPDRMASYRQLQKELRYLEIRQDEAAQREQKRKNRVLHKLIRRTVSHKRRG